MLVGGRLKAVQSTSCGQHIVIHFINPGESIGCVSLMGQAHYSATAVAIRNSVVLRWSVAMIRRLIARHPSIATNALVGLGNRILEMRSRLREVSSEKVERRIARALLRLIRHSGRQVEGGIEIDFPVTRQDVAEMADTTLHTVSRALAKWKKWGILDGGRQRIVITKPHTLVIIVEELDKR